MYSFFGFRELFKEFLYGQWMIMLSYSLACPFFRCGMVSLEMSSMISYYIYLHKIECPYLCTEHGTSWDRGQWSWLPSNFWAWFYLCLIANYHYIAIELIIRLCSVEIDCIWYNELLLPVKLQQGKFYELWESNCYCLSGKNGVIKWLLSIFKWWIEKHF